MDWFPWTEAGIHPRVGIETHVAICNVFQEEFSKLWAHVKGAHIHEPFGVPHDENNWGWKFQFCKRATLTDKSSIELFKIRLIKAQASRWLMKNPFIIKMLIQATARCQFHQHFTVRIFCTNVFFPCRCNYKSCRNVMFIWKICTLC